MISPMPSATLSSPEEGVDKGQIFALERAEPLVHCGISLPVQSGMPRIAVYTEERVYAQLRANTVQFLLDTVSIRPTGSDIRVVLPNVLKTYEADFITRV